MTEPPAAVTGLLRTEARLTLEELAGAGSEPGGGQRSGMGHSRRSTWPARSAAPGTRYTRWLASAGAPWVVARSAEAEAQLAQALKIFPQIGATEATDISLAS